MLGLVVFADNKDAVVKKLQEEESLITDALEEVEEVGLIFICYFISIYLF